MSKTEFNPVHIVGSGLAGSEAAYFLAERGIPVILHEMRPLVNTEAHKTDRCAELVCSNSFKSKSPQSAPGMLKAEMTRMGSLILRSAAGATVPGGEALAVDRDLFAEAVTSAVKSHPLITFVPGEVTQPPVDSVTLLATGPLTSDALSGWLAQWQESVVNKARIARPRQIYTGSDERTYVPMAQRS